MLTELAVLREVILDASSSSKDCEIALDQLALIFSEVGGVAPDPSFDGWDDDSRLQQGVAINPRAAAHCINDYRRSVVFTRGVHAALTELCARQATLPVKVLYAGCGPYALLVLPLLDLFPRGSLELTLLDIHQQSLDSVERLFSRLVATDHEARFVAADACHYQHHAPLDLVIAETMQKALEQEPQFAVTAQLAPQLDAEGIFIPRRVEVELGLPLPQATRPDDRWPLARLLNLEPESAASLLEGAHYSDDSRLQEIDLGVVEIPALPDLARRRATLFTRIEVHGDHHLDFSDCELTLPSPCHELSALTAGVRYGATYQLGGYPRIHLRRID